MVGIYFELRIQNWQPVNENLRNLPKQVLEEQINRLEEDYSDALDKHSDVHALSDIWQKIKELKKELESRNNGTVRN